MPMQAGVMGPPMTMPGRGMVPQHLPGPGRHLQIMDHTVHRIDTNIKANGEEEKEMVVKWLRLVSSYEDDEMVTALHGLAYVFRVS